MTPPDTLVLLPAHRFMDLQKTLATSDGHPCCGLGRISKCVQMLTGRDQHPGSQSLCWITIEWARRWFNRKISFFFSAWLLGFRRLHLLQTYRNIFKQIYLFECVLLAIWRNQTQHPEQSKGRQAFRFVLVCSSGIKQPYLISAKSSGYIHQILAEFVFVFGVNGWTVYSF